MSTHSHRVSLLAGVSLILGACSPAPPSPSPSSTTAIEPSASTSAQPPVLTPSRTSEPSPTAVPPSVTGWVVREMNLGEDGFMDDIAVTSAAGGTIHVMDHLEEAMDNGFDAGRYRRSTDGGRTWGAEHLLRGIDEVVASAGDRVFVAFQAYDCRTGIGVVRNDENGAPGAWSRVTCLPGDSDLAGSQWGPQAAATGSSVYVLSIDSGTSRAHLRTSHDAGRTFTSMWLGEAHPDSEGDVGPVLLSADDDVVAASWYDAGAPVVRVSHDTARSWGPPVPLPGGAIELSVRDGRTLAQGWSGIDAPWYWLSAGGGFEPIAAAGPSATPDPMRWTGTHLAIGPAGALGALNTEACVTTWRTSTDSGASWSTPERIVDGCPAIGTGSPLPVSWLDDGHIVAFLDVEGAGIAERP